jgi:hypothetical protein
MSVVFAAGDPKVGGVDDTAADTQITKILNMPVGTPVPNAAFVFEFAKIGQGKDETDEAKADMPNVPNVTVNIASGDTTTPVGTDALTLSKQSTSGIFGSVTFLHAGVYIYEISEKDGGQVFDANADTTETVTYSEAKYRIKAYVKEHSITGAMYVYAITATNPYDDAGDPYNGGKIDPTPGDGNTTFSAIAFTNEYTLTNNGTTPTNPDHSTLDVSKVVDGGFADKTKYFPFEVSITEPAALPVANQQTYYRAYVVDSTGVVTSTDNADASLIDTDSGGVYIKIAEGGSAVDVNLKHGQTLRFIDTPVGTSYEAKELGTIDYIPSVAVISNSINTTPSTSEAASGAALTTETQYIGSAANSAAFTNTYDASSPTGFDWDDMPYLGLLMLLIAAGVAYLVIRSRKKKSYN